MKTKSRIIVLLVAALLQYVLLLPVWGTELIVNGGFESGWTGWTLSGGASASVNGGFARSGTYFLWLGGAVGENDAGYQATTLPANATAATLSFFPAPILQGCERLRENFARLLS
jgi:hypothetical protein